MLVFWSLSPLLHLCKHQRETIVCWQVYRHCHHVNRCSLSCCSQCCLQACLAVSCLPLLKKFLASYLQPTVHCCLHCCLQACLAVSCLPLLEKCLPSYLQETIH